MWKVYDVKCKDGDNQSLDNCGSIVILLLREHVVCLQVSKEPTALFH